MSIFVYVPLFLLLSLLFSWLWSWCRSLPSFLPLLLPLFSPFSFSLSLHFAPVFVVFLILLSFFPFPFTASSLLPRHLSFPFLVLVIFIVFSLFNIRYSCRSIITQVKSFHTIFFLFSYQIFDPH